MAAEGPVRNLPTFSEFLDVAALSDGELVNFSNVGRECGVSSHTARSYFGILEDTLLGRWLPAYRKRPKRRVIQSPKFYFADVGVVNRLARRGEVHPGSELYGKALENWLFHELTVFASYRGYGRMSRAEATDHAGRDRNPPGSDVPPKALGRHADLIAHGYGAARARPVFARSPRAWGQGAARYPPLFPSSSSKA